MSKLFKRTKILATVGPAVRSEEKITELVMAGANGCRLNFSHGTYEEHEEEIKWIRAASEKKGRSIAILQDLQGPKIRLGILKDNRLDVHVGDELILDSAIIDHDGSLIVPIQYNLADKVKIGEPVSLFDGKIKASVKEVVSDTAIKINIENDGFLMSRKGMNLPETDFGGDVFTEKDLNDIAFGASHDIDYVAMSFIQSADDVKKLRELLAQHNSTAKIISKIETKKAIENDEKLEEIVKASDGIMVARGDMAVEAGNEVVPVVQRKLIAFCRRHSKFCIVATQMLSSMVDNPEPTRAEVSDVANAVLQGADVVMLSDETTNGKFPIETVKEMKKIILYTQNHLNITELSQDPTSEYQNYDAIASTVTDLAEKIGADLIVCQTASGTTSRIIAAQRPNLPIISVTSNPRAANQLALIYGNTAFVRPYSSTYGIDLVAELKSSGYLKTAEGKSELLAVIVSGDKDKIAGTDTIRIRHV
ncbi:pyruvate kinase [Candidatus Saccharibacteria bacterium]|nr:pyruvate kinase [Candidatus Saccharibacteria bacterium]